MLLSVSEHAIIPYSCLWHMKSISEFSSLVTDHLPRRFHRGADPRPIDTSSEAGTG